MVFAAEFGTGEVLWSILWFSLFVLWIWLVISIFGDIMRANDLSGWAKGMWAVGIIVLPFLGIFLYLIVNGSAMNRRTQQQFQAHDEATQAYIRDAAGSSSAADQLAQLASLHESGKLSDDEYERAKSRVVGA